MIKKTRTVVRMRPIQVEISDCVCDMCGHTWTMRDTKRPTFRCPSPRCHSPKWNDRDPRTPIDPKLRTGLEPAELMLCGVEMPWDYCQDTLEFVSLMGKKTKEQVPLEPDEIRWVQCLRASVVKRFQYDICTGKPVEAGAVDQILAEGKAAWNKPRPAPVGAVHPDDAPAQAVTEPDGSDTI